MTDVKVYVHGKTKPMENLIESIMFMHKVGADAPDVTWLRTNEVKDKTFVDLIFEDIDQADRMAQTINSMDPSMTAELINESGDSVPIADLQQARRSQGIMVHLPDGPEYLQHTLITGTRASGKTQTLLRAMINVSANPHSILVVNAYADADSWKGLRPNQLLADRNASTALSWTLGQMKQRQFQVDSIDDEPRSFKPIVLVLDDPDLSTPGMRDLEYVLNKGLEIGVFVYMSRTVNELGNGRLSSPSVSNPITRANFSRFIETKRRSASK